MLNPIAATTYQTRRTPSQKVGFDYVAAQQPQPPQRSKLARLRDLNFEYDLSKSVGCKPNDLKVVMGPHELKERLKSSKPENFNPRNAQNGLFNINMHMHTTASDGEFTPQSLLTEAQKLAQNNKYKGQNKDFVVAITDHDNFDGVKNALSYIATETHKNQHRFDGVRFVPGIELNTKYENSSFLKKPLQLETLVYDVNPYNSEFANMVEKTRTNNAGLINSVIAEAKDKYGIDTSDFNEVREEESAFKAPVSTGIQRNFAKYFKQKNVPQNTISQLLNEKRFPAHDATEYTPSITDTLSKKGEGVAVIAHPIRLNFHDCTKDEVKKNNKWEDSALLTLFRDFKTRGGDGAEANYQYNNGIADRIKIFPELNRVERDAKISGLCKQAGLLPSGGLDNHHVSLVTR